MKTSIPSAAKMNLVFLGLVILILTVCPVSAQEVDDCLSCHDDSALVRKSGDDAGASLYVDKQMYLKSVHAEMEYGCTDCHDGPTLAEHKDGQKYEKISCSDCHDEAAQKHGNSSHGQLVKAGNLEAPNCQNCHTTHAVLRSDNVLSTVHPENLALTCGQCHPAEASPGLVGLLIGFVQGKKDIPNPGIVQTLLSAIPTRVRGHGKVNMSCDFDTNKCSNCHFEVVNHGNDELQSQECAKCHTMDKSRILFGTIHKSGFGGSPLMIVLSLLCYLAAAGFVVKCVMDGRSRKEKTKEAVE